VIVSIEIFVAEKSATTDLHPIFVVADSVATENPLLVL